MAYDAVNMADWQISEEAEKNMPTPEDWVDKLGLEKDEMLPMGRHRASEFDRHTTWQSQRSTAPSLQSRASGCCCANHHQKT